MKHGTNRRKGVLGLLLGALLVVVAGCATTQSPGGQLDDRAITAKVEAKLAGDPDVSAFKVDVDTHEGVVRLSGNVKTAEAKAAAARLARETDGVVRVQNDIAVGTETAGEKIDDGWITTKIKAKITGSSELNPFNINVDTDGGVVTLMGTVKDDEKRQLAEEIARNTEGVKDVKNMLQVEEGS